MSAILPEGGEGRAEESCVRWSTDDGSAHRIFDHEGKAWLAIIVRAKAWEYARVARRDDAILVLSPRPRVDTTRRAAQCECVGDPKMRSPSWYVFLLDDEPASSVHVEQVEVPIDVEALSWPCERTLL